MKSKKIKFLLWTFLLFYIVYLIIHGIDKDSAIYNLIHIFSNANNFLLLLYALGFVCVYAKYQKHKKNFDTGSFLYLIYVMGGVGGCWYYSQDKVDISYPIISIGALLYLFVTINICLFPLWKAKFSSLYYIDDKGMSGVYDAISLMFCILSILPLLSLLSNFSFGLLIGSNLGDMYESNVDKASMFFSGPSKICFALIRRFEMLVIVLFFYQLSKRNIKYAYGLCLPIIVFTLFKLLSGSRGGLVGTGLLLVTLFLMLKQTLADSVRKSVVKIGSVGAGIFALALAAISISRFSLNTRKSYTIDMWISQYLGESLPRFSDDVWGTRIHLYGYQNFMYFRKVLGLPYIEDYDVYKSVYETKLCTPVDVFYTFMGDFYIDFGLIGGVIFALFFAYAFSRFLRIKKSITIPTLTVLCLFFNMLGFGFAANVYRTLFVQKDLMWLLLLILVLSVLERAKKANTISPPPRI